MKAQRIYRKFEAMLRSSHRNLYDIARIEHDLARDCITMVAENIKYQVRHEIYGSDSQRVAEAKILDFFDDVGGQK